MKTKIISVLAILTLAVSLFIVGCQPTEAPIIEKGNLTQIWDGTDFLAVASGGGITVSAGDITATSLITGSGNENLSSANSETSIAADFCLNQVTFTFDAATSNAIVIILNSNAGASADTVLKNITMVAASDAVWIPTGDLCFVSGDEVYTTWTNGASTTVGLTWYTSPN